MGIIHDLSQATLSGHGYRRMRIGLKLMARFSGGTGPHTGLAKAVAPGLRPTTPFRNISVVCSRGRYGLVRFILGGALFSLAGQLALGQTSPPCVLSGTVVNSAAGVGIAHALVSYRGLAAGYRFTDATGNFRVDNLPAGQYVLSASKPGFVSEQELSSRQNVFALMGAREDNAVETAQNFQLTPSQTFQPVQLKPDSPLMRIKLIPVSAIGGTVLDENDEPLEGVSVQMIAVRATLTGLEYATVQTSSTDDRGRYLFLKLLPGDYIVRLAGEVSSTQYFSGILNPNNDHRGLRPVYYPSGDSTSGAFVFHLAAGEQTNADFQQRTEAAFDIDGHLSGFAPRAWTQMQVYRDGDRLPIARAYVNVSNGRFRVIDVPPGSYTLRVAQYESDSEKWLAAEVPVSITAEPIRNLVVELAGAANIPVSVAYEAGAQPNGMLHLALQPQHARQNARQLMLGQSPHPLPSPGGEQPEPSPEPEQEQTSRFENVIPDQYKLAVQTFGSEYVASATLGDRDILHGEFPIGGGAGEMRIVVRGDSATIEGLVTSNGQPAVGASVCLIPAGGGLGFKCGTGDESGHYIVQGVAPGDYRIAGWYGMPTIEQFQSGLGNSLTVEAGEHRTATVEASRSIDLFTGQEGPTL